MPQNLITEQSLRELPEINGKDLEFVLAIYEGMPQTDAYKAVYANEGTKPTTIWSEASKKANNPKIRPWLEYIKLQQLKAASYTIDEHIKELDELRLLSINSGNMGAAVNATVNKGKARGLYVERVEDVTYGKDDIHNALVELFGQSVADQITEKEIH